LWLPRFACPDCSGDLDQDGVTRASCLRCATSYERRGGIWRFLSETRRTAVEPFASQYRLVREREGYRVTSADYYRSLPEVDSDDPRSAQWNVRRESYGHLGHLANLTRGHAARVLDLGAGNAWLSYRLAAAGHAVVALDILDDEADGLGVTRMYGTPFTAVQADFDALPFAPGQFDVVVFNASLHYAPNPETTMALASTMLASEGSLVVMDSPLFERDGDGRAMVEEMARNFERDHGLRDVVRPGAGYLTFARLSAIAARLDMRFHYSQSRGPIGWRLRRQLSGLKLRRRPAAFGVWVAAAAVTSPAPTN
jgi:SAM-dependent methyltransferase